IEEKTAFTIESLMKYAMEEKSLIAQYLQAKKMPFNLSQCPDLSQPQTLSLLSSPVFSFLVNLKLVTEDRVLQEYVELVSHLLQPDPSKRWSANKVLKDLQRIWDSNLKSQTNNDYQPVCKTGLQQPWDRTGAWNKQVEK